jgi:hypothetical protein
MSVLEVSTPGIVIFIPPKSKGIDTSMVSEISGGISVYPPPVSTPK